MLTTINLANLSLTHGNWVALMPYLIMLAGAMGSMLLGTISFGHGSARKMPLFLFSNVTVLCAGIWSAVHAVHEPMPLFGGMMQLDHFSSFFNILICSATFLVMLGCYSYLENEHIHFSEFYPILLISSLGMMLLASTTELLCIFIALELMSLAVYVLVGMRRKNSLSNEAAVKYFIMGGVAAAIYLYGVALVYGATSTTKLSYISLLFNQSGTSIFQNPILLVGLVLITVGFLFKVAVAPFQMWTPDVYEGAPVLITGYMATALKAAVFAAFIRVSVVFMGDQGAPQLSQYSHIVHNILWWLALLTMVIGNFVALQQFNLKRMLAYSAIAHTGYLLVGMLAGPKVGYSNIVLYLVAYIAMNLGAFGILGIFAGKGDRELTTQNMLGLAHRHPWAAAALTVFLLSLGGMPPTAGFVAKYYLFAAAVEAGELPLVLLGVLTSAAAVYYYLRVVVLMYMQEKDGNPEFVRAPSLMAYLAIAICVALTINFGLFPAQILHAVKRVALF